MDLATKITDKHHQKTRNIRLLGKKKSANSNPVSSFATVFCLQEPLQTGMTPQQQLLTNNQQLQNLRIKPSFMNTLFSMKQMSYKRVKAPTGNRKTAGEDRPDRRQYWLYPVSLFSLLYQVQKRWGLI